MSTSTRLVGGTVVTQDRDRYEIDDGEVAFDAEGVLTYVGPSRGPAGPRDHDLTGTVVMPGLVNAHTHSAMTLLRGCSDDADLATWLGAVQSLEQHMTADDLATGLRLALVEMLRSGTTTFADMYHWDADLLGHVVDAGMRVSAAHAIFDHDHVGFPRVSAMTGRDGLEHTSNLAREFAGERRVRIRYGPHAPYTSSPEMLTDIAERAERHGLGIHIHLSESAFEVRAATETFGRTPVMHVDHLGLFRASVLVAHAVHATEEEIEVLATRGAAVGHNPVSNLKLGSGVAPVAAMRDAGVRLALGTDGAASNNSLDLFEEIKTGTVLHRGVTQDPLAVAGSDVLAMATSQGADAVGFPEVGALEAGRWADVVVLRTDTPHATPMPSPTSFLAFAARGSDVRDVFVGGRHVMRDGELTTIDEEAVRADAARAAHRLHALAGDQ